MHPPEPTMPAPARTNPSTAPRSADDPRRRPRTFYVDFARLEATAAGTGAVRAYRPVKTGGPAQPRRVTTVDTEVTALRRNVRDAARAVLTWLASVTQHDGDGNLDRVLDRCLRPGADASEVNYSALATEINTSLGVDFSAKRIQTAVRHLRHAARQSRTRQASGTALPSTSSTLTDRFDALQAKLQTHYDALLQEQGGAVSPLQRAVAHDVLAVLRSAAGRLIECGFGEGIPRHVDLDATRQRFLVFVHQIVRRGRGTGGAGEIGETAGGGTLRDDLGRLLIALNPYDGTAEADMRLVVCGARVVADLAGPGSLPGLMAKLNVLMAGRPMLDSGFFVDQMLALADAAGGLIDNKAARAYMGWVRHQPKDRQTPSPNRVRSYCLNNAATHVLERLYTGELTGGRWFQTAQHCFETMQQHDRGFALLKTTEAIMLSVLAELTGSAGPAQGFFKKLGRAGSLDLLLTLRRFDNSDDLNRLVRRRAQRVHPGLKGQLLVLPQ
jgi:hypothetical protein